MGAEMNLTGECFTVDMPFNDVNGMLCPSGRTYHVQVHNHDGFIRVETRLSSKRIMRNVRLDDILKNCTFEPRLPVGINPISEQEFTDKLNQQASLFMEIKKAKPACECGVSIVSGPIHSDWCPLYE